MSGKEIAKLGVGVAILGMAAVIFVVRSGAAGDTDDEKTYWWCSTEKKSFEISAAEHDQKVRTGRKTESPDAGGDVKVRRSSGGFITIALSPYTKKWTGIPAAKCGDCGEVYPLDTESKGENLCPKCNWNPATGKKGSSTGEKFVGEDGEKDKEEKDDK